MRRLIPFIVFLVWTQLCTQAQSAFSVDEEHLSFYADVLVNADAGTNRDKANEIFYRDLQESLNKNGSFAYDYTELKWISFQYPDDRSFRLITWQLKSDDNNFSYYGFYQDADQVIELKSTVDFSKSLSNQNLNPDHWYGRLIYDLISFEDERGAYYMLFGFSQLDQYNKTKVVEILRVEDGQPTFGAPMFDDGTSDIAKLRLSFRYSADSMLNVDYNKGLNMLVYDHLIQRMGRMPGQGPTYLPDGTYEAYKLELGEWVYVEQLYNEIIEKPDQGTKKETRDILGRVKGN